MTAKKRQDANALRSAVNKTAYRLNTSFTLLTEAEATLAEAASGTKAEGDCIEAMRAAREAIHIALAHVDAMPTDQPEPKEPWNLMAMIRKVKA